MSKNLLIVGAGAGFAQATAQRFGSDGWTVHLLARSADGLDRLAKALGENGVNCQTYQGDVTAHNALTELVAEIDRESVIDACVFQPRGEDNLVDVTEATVDNVRPNLEMLVLGAVATGSALVPRMMERRSGSLVFVGGGSARLPLRMFGNLGMAMSGLRSYAMTLNKAVAEYEVHSAFYTVAGMIGAAGAAKPGEIDPVALAERLYTLVRDRDAAEVLMTADGEVAVKGSK